MAKHSNLPSESKTATRTFTFDKAIVFGSALGPYAYSLAAANLIHGFAAAVFLSALPAIPIFIAGLLIRIPG